MIDASTAMQTLQKSPFFNPQNFMTGGIPPNTPPFEPAVEPTNPFLSGADPTGGMPQAGQPWTGGDYQFPFPEQWGQASDIFSQFGAGVRAPTPGAWSFGQDILQKMAQSGMPVDVSGIQQAWTPVAQTMMEDLTKQAAEEAGVGGIRWSTPLQHKIGEFGQRIGENIGLEAMRAQIAAEEAARARMLGATGQLYQYGAGEAGLETDMLNRMMQSAMGLQNIGMDYLMAPSQIAGQMMGMSGQMQGLQNQALQGYYTNPFMQYALAMRGQNPPQYMEQGPGGFSQFMNILGGVSPYIIDWLQNRGGGGMTPQQAVQHVF